MATAHQHPTVRAYNLVTYESRYDGTRCVLCGEDAKKGETIALLASTDRQPNVLADRLRMKLHALHLVKGNVKSFKYAHVGCLPIAATEEDTAAVREVASYLIGLTDPEWPKDEVGLSKATSGPVDAWMATGCDHFGTWRVACALQIHYGQLSEAHIAANRKAVLAGYTTRREWKRNLKNPVTGEVEPEPSVSNGDSVAYNPDHAPMPISAAPAPKPEPAPAPKKDPPVRIGCIPPSLFTIATEKPWVYPRHGEVKDRVKALGARFDYDTKLWHLRGELLAANWDKIFSGVEVEISPEATEAFKAYQTRAALSTAKDASWVSDETKAMIQQVVPDGQSLYPFQIAGLGFLLASNGRALIGDEQGLGKTVQALAYLAMRPELRPAVLVVPAVVATNWCKEAARWNPKDIAYRVKNSKDEIPKNATLIVVTYDLLKRRLDEIKALQPKALIADEAQYLKEYDTQRTQAFLAVAQLPSVKALIGLSGTPLVNRPKEFFTILHLLRQGTFPSWMRYTKEFCGGERTRWGYVCNGATNTDKLAHLVRDAMVRRLKADVLTELPEKTFQTIDIELGDQEKKAYKKAITDAVAKVSGAQELTAINAGRQWVGAHKVASAMEMIEQHAEQGQPLLVFAHHKAVLDALEQACSSSKISYGRIDGTTSGQRRGELVDSFQAGSLDVMLISVQAGGVGITLTRAQNVLFVERSWTPGAEAQAMDRAHRIGQKGAVTVRFLRVLDTVDEDMDELLQAKAKVLTSVLDGADPENLNIQAELIARMAERLRNTKPAQRTRKAS